MENETHKSMVLMMAENYYTVAAHLRQQSNRLAEVAEQLEGMADQMCEHNIKQNSAHCASEGRS